ncbi:hypothetical protein [Undibacterium crateris]|uniref:hypothetical protein n=1 Tax=Undibacterium crateris TaxID=2528175 RepID=UPI00138A1684|nr:hypothetical protein [Undibacterium crateris]NDI87456.1 hypothetical protein [Undibacterium crateris]
MAADEKIAGIRWANTKETRLKTQVTGEVVEDDSGESNEFTASQSLTRKVRQIDLRKADCLRVAGSLEDSQKRYEYSPNYCE